MITSVTIKIVVAALVLAGTALSFISVFGVLRLPDVYTRIHAATKSTTLGVLCILLGAFIYFWYTENIISIRLILGIAFVFLTAPVSGHLICRAAHNSGVALAKESVQDDLRIQKITQRNNSSR